MQVLTGTGTMRPQAHAGLLGAAERFDDTSGFTQDRAESRGGALVKIGYSHDMLARPDNQRPQIHRAHHVVNHPGRGQGNDAPGQITPPGKQIVPQASNHTHGARTELLTALTVHWLTTRVTASEATTPAVVIAGADTLSSAHLEALNDAC